MSPQLLGAKLGAWPSAHGGRCEYDGTKVDIWAAGVMLCVMLIGRFPFEGTEMSHVTNLDDVSEHVSGGSSDGGSPDWTGVDCVVWSGGSRRWQECVCVCV